MSCHVAGNFGRRRHYLESGAENAINSCLWAQWIAAALRSVPPIHFKVTYDGRPILSA